MRLSSKGGQRMKRETINFLLFAFLLFAHLVQQIQIDELRHNIDQLKEIEEINIHSINEHSEAITALAKTLTRMVR
jgi:hypothetical protein